MTLPWQLAASLGPQAFAEVRLATIFDCRKWDPQVEDTSILSPAPLILDAGAWDTLASESERLTRELLAAEQELLARPDLHAYLGLPRSVRRALCCGPACTGAARVMRFDFHYTSDGWQISEVNSDVPGGFIESSGFTRLISDRYPQAFPVGDPAAAYVDAICRAVGPGSSVALVHSTAYTDDRQVMLYLERGLQDRGLRTVLISPDQLRWHAGRALVATEWHNGPVDLLVRFYPAEWLPNLRRSCGWPNFFTNGLTPISNPAYALMTQSKRFPLLWPKLRTRLATWQRLLPETYDPREVDWQNDGRAWVLKPALGRVGEDVAMDGVSDSRTYGRVAREVRRFPRRWVAQRRFRTILTNGQDGPVYPCFGVFTIDGRPAGIYGRLAATPIVDHRARDAAVLVAKGGAPAANSGDCQRDGANRTTCELAL